MYFAACFIPFQCGLDFSVKHGRATATIVIGEEGLNTPIVPLWVKLPRCTSVVKPPHDYIYIFTLHHTICHIIYAYCKHGYFSAGKFQEKVHVGVTFTIQMQFRNIYTH